MEKLYMRVMLLVLMGIFLFLSGIFMDVMGGQIKSSGTGNSPRLPFSPLVLVGRCVLAVGVAMLLAALYFKLEERFRAKSESPFHRESVSPDIINDSQAMHTESQEANSQNTSNQSTTRASIAAYSDTDTDQHREQYQHPQLFGRHLMNYYPASAPPYHRPQSSTLSDHNYRYSEIYEDKGHILCPSSDSPSAVLISNYRVSPRASSPYANEDLVNTYESPSPEHAFRPIAYSQWERTIVGSPRTRSFTPENDLPPPYETAIIPPSYSRLTTVSRSYNN